MKTEDIKRKIEEILAGNAKQEDRAERPQTPPAPAVGTIEINGTGNYVSGAGNVIIIQRVVTFYPNPLDELTAAYRFLSQAFKSALAMCQIIVKIGRHAGENRHFVPKDENRENSMNPAPVAASREISSAPPCAKITTAPHSQRKFLANDGTGRQILFLPCPSWAYQ